MILSLLVGLVSILVSVLGLKCTRLGRTSEQVKGRLGLSGGVLFILSGLNPELSQVFFHRSSLLTDWFLLVLFFRCFHSGRRLLVRWQSHP